MSMRISLGYKSTKHTSERSRNAALNKRPVFVSPREEGECSRVQEYRWEANHSLFPLP